MNLSAAERSEVEKGVEVLLEDPVLEPRRAEIACGVRLVAQLGVPAAFGQEVILLAEHRHAKRRIDAPHRPAGRVEAGERVGGGVGAEAADLGIPDLMADVRGLEERGQDEDGHRGEPRHAATRRRRQPPRQPRGWLQAEAEDEPADHGPEVERDVADVARATRHEPLQPLLERADQQAAEQREDQCGRVGRSGEGATEEEGDQAVLDEVEELHGVHLVVARAEALHVEHEQQGRERQGAVARRAPGADARHADRQRPGNQQRGASRHEADPRRRKGGLEEVPELADERRREDQQQRGRDRRNQASHSTA